MVVINLALKSHSLIWWVSLFGVYLLVGLIGYNAKANHAAVERAGESASDDTRGAIENALSVYLDFVFMHYTIALWIESFFASQYRSRR